MPRLVARKPDASLVRVSREPRLLACLREIPAAFALPSAGAVGLTSCWMDLHTRLQAARGVSTAAAKHLDGAVIITGGLGALGALTSAWLCGTSSQSDLWLLGRSGRASESHAGMPRPRQHGRQDLVCRAGFPFLPCRWRDDGATGPQRAAGHLCQGRRVGSRGSCTRSDLGWVGFSTLARHIACWCRAKQQSHDQCQCYNHPDRICRCVLPQHSLEAWSCWPYPKGVFLFTGVSCILRRCPAVRFMAVSCRSNRGRLLI